MDTSKQMDIDMDKEFATHNPVLNSNLDATMFFVHVTLLRNQFQNDVKNLFDQWKQGDVYSVKYQREDATYEIKGLLFGTHFVLLARTDKYADEEPIIHSVHLPSAVKTEATNYAEYYVDVNGLYAELMNNFVMPLIHGRRQGDKMHMDSQSHRINREYNTTEAPSSSLREPGSGGPINLGINRQDDPLRVDKGPMGRFETHQPGVGGIGGNRVGPTHPMFTSHVRGDRWRQGGWDPHQAPQRMPGARFDPWGPDPMHMGGRLGSADNRLYGFPDNDAEFPMPMGSRDYLI